MPTPTATTTSRAKLKTIVSRAPHTPRLIRDIRPQRGIRRHELSTQPHNSQRLYNSESGGHGGHGGAGGNSVNGEEEWWIDEHDSNNAGNNGNGRQRQVRFGPDSEEYCEPENDCGDYSSDEDDCSINSQSHFPQQQLDQNADVGKVRKCLRLLLCCVRAALVLVSNPTPIPSKRKLIKRVFWIMILLMVWKTIYFADLDDYSWSDSKGGLRSIVSKGRESTSGGYSGSSAGKSSGGGSGSDVSSISGGNGKTYSSAGGVSSGAVSVKSKQSTGETPLSTARKSMSNMFSSLPSFSLKGKSGSSSNSSMSPNLDYPAAASYGSPGGSSINAPMGSHVGSSINSSNGKSMNSMSAMSSSPAGSSASSGLRGSSLKEELKKMGAGDYSSSIALGIERSYGSNPSSSGSLTGGNSNAMGIGSGTGKGISSGTNGAFGSSGSGGKRMGDDIELSVEGNKPSNRFNVMGTDFEEGEYLDWDP